MKYITSILVLCAFFITSSCKKDKAEKPAVSDFPFALYDLKSSYDTTHVDVFFFPSTLILHSNYTWTLQLGSAKSNGTFTWTPMTANQAQVKFKIVQWTPFTSDTSLSNRVEDVLLRIENCTYSDAPFQFLDFDNSTYTINLRTKAK